MSEPYRIWAWHVGGWTGKFVDYEPQEQDKAWTTEYIRVPSPELVERGNALISRALHTHNRDAWSQDAFEYIRDLLKHLEANHD